MKKEWFIIIDGKQQGPFSFEDLKMKSQITPDTLVWKDGFKNWIPLREVAELKGLFYDEEESESIIERFKPKKITITPTEEAEQTLSFIGDPLQFFVWAVIILLVIIYLINQFFF